MFSHLICCTCQPLLAKTQLYIFRTGGDLAFPHSTSNMAYTTPRGVYGTGAYMKPPNALPQTYHAPMPQQQYYPMDMQHMAYEAVRSHQIFC